MRIPKEHGAWAMLYVPYVVGALSAGAAALAHVPELLLLLAAVTALFLGRESLLAWLRRRDRGQESGAAARATRWQLGGAGACAAALLATRPPWPVLPLGILGGLVLGIHVVQMRRREARTVLGEILAIVGLTLAAPAAFLVGLDTESARALVLWVLCALFFASSVLHVKSRVLSVQPRRAAERRTMRRASAAYHVLLLAALGALAGLGRLHSFYAVAFLPVVARALVALAASPGRLDLTRAGILEIVYSLHFLVFVTLAAHGA
jgi:hypothetical protein